MTDRDVHHATFVIERTYPATPARVFAAFATEAGKAKWFSGPNERWTIAGREFDFRVGGRERLRGVWTTGMVSEFQAVYLDIVPDRRIVYAYDMHVNDKKISVSLGTIEIHPDGQGARLIYTEQGAYFDGTDDGRGREHGTIELLNTMERSLSEPV